MCSLAYVFTPNAVVGIMVLLLVLASADTTTGARTDPSTILDADIASASAATAAGHLCKFTNWTAGGATLLGSGTSWWLKIALICLLWYHRPDRSASWL